MTITKQPKSPYSDRNTYSIQQISSDSKRFTFSVIDLGLLNDHKYNFRAVVKCKAGFPTIVDREATPEYVATNWKRNCLLALQVNMKGAPGYEELTQDCWLSCLNIKGNKFVSVDKTLLDNMCVGDIHACFPKMADFAHWNLIGSKSHACSAYGDIDALSIPSSILTA